MQFILTGFTQDMAFRVFAFERMGLDRIRTKYAVRADLALIRRYGIQVQELPLLCRNLLVRNDGAEEREHTLTFTEDDMSLHAKGCAAAKDAAAQKRKPPRRPHSENVGAAWRGHHPLQAAHTPPSTAAASAGQAGGTQGIDEQKIIETT
jgi:hypothetical protein